MTGETWSVTALQDLILDNETWDKKNLYATDSEKCPAGLYYALLGEKATNPPDAQSLRRMEVGKMIELNLVKKFRSQGILIEAQRRLYDEEHKVSGKHDGIIINPMQCTPRAKELIERKKEIYNLLEELDKETWTAIGLYQEKALSKEDLLNLQADKNSKKQDLFDEDFEINQELLIPDPENSLMVMEIKSTTEKGFKWREDQGEPADSHKKQTMFYLWKLRDIFPNILGRVIYTDTSYQNLLEFDVSDLDMDLIEDMKRFWKYINKCVEEKTPPPASPSIVKDPKYGKWKVNYQAEWCNHHALCTGDPNWLTKAIQEVQKLNKK